MKNYIIIVIVSFCSIIGYGQSKTLVIDGATNEPLILASGAFLDTKDSSILKTFQSDFDGFVTSTPPEGRDVTMQLRFVGYNNFSKLIKSGSSLPDTIKMSKDGILLNQVQINAEKLGVKVNEDTIQFNAGAFNIKPNDMAEDLLKKLPGVQVEADGSIKAQGEKINKITVDGKPFFGTDPMMATKNIPADAIDKVEVFERKSDQSVFSGFDDGSGERSINFTLKPDKRKAKFGRVEAGYGTEDRYEGSFTYFNFNGDRQISVLGMSNNANKSGFTMEDASAFMSASGATNQGGPGGGGGGRGPGGGGFGSLFNANTLGINQNSSVGVNFKDMLSKKLEFSGSYFLGSGNSRTEDKIFRENFVPDNPFFSNIESSSRSTNTSHRFNFSLDYAIDSSNSIKFEPSINIQNNTSNSLTTTNNFKNNIDSLSNSRVSLDENRDSWRIGGQVLYRHKFKMDGRTLSVRINPRLSDTKSTTYNISRSKVFDNSPFKDTTNLQIENDQTGYGLNSNISYTEPISKILSLETAYNYNYDQNARNRVTNSFNEFDQEYSEFEGLLSNNFKNDYATHKGSVSLQYKKLKYQVTITGAYQHALLSSRSIRENEPFSKSFDNFLPSANAKFTISKSKSINLNYNSSTRQPNLDDIQPIPDLSDPLNIKIGNPNLGQEYTHSIRANYRSFDAGKNQFMSIFLRGDYTLDKIVTNSTTNFFGANTSRKLNADGYFGGNLFVNFGMPYKKVNFNVGSSNSYRREISFVNDEKNLGDIFNYGLNIKAIFNPTDKMEYSIGGNGSRTSSSYSLQTKQNNSYNDLSAQLSAKVELPWNFRIETDVNFTQRSGLASGFNQHFTIWNASITKAFLSNKAFELTLKGYDLLNENIAVSQNTTSTYIEDVNSLTLANYFMLTARYYINRPKNNMPKGMDMNRMHMMRN